MRVRFPQGKLARSSLSTGAILGGRVAIQALGLLLLVRLFDPSMYGRLASAGTLAVLLGLLPPFGSGFVLMARAPQGPDAAPDVWRYAWPMTLVLGALLALAYIPMARIVAGNQTLPVGVLSLLAVTEILAMPLVSLASFALQSRERVPLSQVVQSLPFALRAVALLPCFLVPVAMRLSAYALSQCIATIVALAISFAVTRRHFDTRGRARLPTRHELGNGATYASMHIVAANATELDKVFALRLIGAHDTGVYALASRILVAMMMPINAMLLAAQPRLFGHAHSPSDAGHRLIGMVGKSAGAWGVLASLLLLALSAIVPMVFGPEYAPSARIMRWMALIAPLMGLRMAAGTVLVTLGRPLDRLTFELAGILVMIGSLLAIGGALGSSGVVLAVGIAESVMLAIGGSMVFRRIRVQKSLVNTRSQ
jgi:O-antigen/teichoic acid export membrane protein